MLKNTVCCPGPRRLSGQLSILPGRAVPPPGSASRIRPTRLDTWRLSRRLLPQGAAIGQRSADWLRLMPPRRGAKTSPKTFRGRAYGCPRIRHASLQAPRRMLAQATNVSSAKIGINVSISIIITSSVWCTCPWPSLSSPPSAHNTEHLSPTRHRRTNWRFHQ